MTDFGRDWKPKQQIFEEAGVVYSREHQPEFTAFEFSAERPEAPRGQAWGKVWASHIWVLGDKADLETLLAHWNSIGKWRYIST